MLNLVLENIRFLYIKKPYGRLKKTYKWMEEHGKALVEAASKARQEVQTVHTANIQVWAPHHRL